MWLLILLYYICELSIVWKSSRVYSCVHLGHTITAANKDCLTTRPTLLQLWRFKTRRPTFLNNIHFGDLLILGALEIERAGRGLFGHGGRALPFTNMNSPDNTNIRMLCHYPVARWKCIYLYLLHSPMSILPDQTFHNVNTSQFEDWLFFCCLGTSLDRCNDFKTVKSSVKYLLPSRLRTKRNNSISLDYFFFSFYFRRKLKRKDNTKAVFALHMLWLHRQGYSFFYSYARCYKNIQAD